MSTSLATEEAHSARLASDSVPLSRARLDSIHAARGIAALLVVFFHCNLVLSFPENYGKVPLAGAFAFGNCGVTFFFVLSGFLMMRVHQKDIDTPERIARYLWRRFARIYPPYWVAFLLAAATFLVLPHLGYLKRLNGLNLLVEWFLAPTPSISQPIISVAWTLHLEVLFYLAFGLLILSMRAGLSLMAAWTIGILALNAYYSGDLPPHLAFYFGIRNLGFVLGQLSGYLLSLRLGSITAARLCCALGAALFIGTGGMVDLAPAMRQSERSIFVLLTTLGYLLGASLLIVGFTRLEELNCIKVSAWLKWLGSASYSIYLIHTLVINGLLKVMAATRMSSRVPLNLMFLLLASTSVAVAFSFHLLVEAPLAARFSKFWPRST